MGTRHPSGPQTPSPAPWRTPLRAIGHHLGLLMVLCLVAPAYLAWTWTDQLGAIDSDGPEYLLMARHYSAPPGEDAAASLSASFSRFPPLYPLALAYLHATGDLHLAHLVTTLFFLAALAAVYFWLSTNGLARALSALLLLLFAATPQSWLLGLLVQSEYLYLALSFAALGCMACFVKKRNERMLYLAAAVVSAAALTRSAGLTLLPALLIVALRAPRKTMTLTIAAAAAPLLVWSAAHAGQHAYLSSLLSSLDSHPLQQLLVDARAMRLGFEQDFGMTPSAWRLADVLGLAALAGLAVRLCRLEVDGIYGMGYLCLLLIWPYPDEARRLIWPIVPLLLGQALLLLSGRRQGDGQGRRNAWIAGTVGVMILWCSLPAVALASQRAGAAATSNRPAARGMVYWYDVDPARAQRWVNSEDLIVQSLLRIGPAVPEQDCVISVRPELIGYFAHRRSTYPPPDSVPDPEFMRRLKAPGCRFVFMVRRGYTGFPTPLHPLQRIAGNAAAVDYSSSKQGGSGQGDIVALLVTLD